MARKYNKERRGNNSYKYSAEMLHQVFAADEVVSLRLLTAEMMPDMLALIKEDSLNPGSYDDLDFSETFRSMYLQDYMAYYAIYAREAQEFVGYCGFSDLREAAWELEIVLRKEHRRKGYGYHALSTLLEITPHLTGQHHYFAELRSDNLPCQRLVEKLGGTLDGIAYGLIEIEEARMNEIDKNLVMLADRFRAQQEKFCSQVLVYKIEK